ncbi:hypothetical protein LOAG_04072 [Loa loa]|uniref:Uncharacterized protein n=1 Tax=Loa loa TaxID=7209 RepID=A0A1S0U3Q1_LOALO|nr:hypothetical protein LOAG_04072 [Loa loa]EFO24412.1 hypothetical protein LOAG_04072 [Loa loa]
MVTHQHKSSEKEPSGTIHHLMKLRRHVCMPDKSFGTNASRREGHAQHELWPIPAQCFVTTGHRAGRGVHLSSSVVLFRSISFASLFVAIKNGDSGSVPR